MTPFLGDSIEDRLAAVIAIAALAWIFYTVGAKYLILAISVVMGICGSISFIMLVSRKDTTPYQKKFETTLEFSLCIIFFIIAIILYGVQAQW